MHTVRLKAEEIDITLGGTKIDPLALFPDFDRNDRMGLAVDQSIGILGAQMLMQSFAIAFYDFRRKSGHVEALYPEIYAIQIGGEYGDYRMLDVAPDRKHVRVRNSAEALEMINQCGITRLATARLKPEDEKFIWWELGAAKDRIKSLFLYGADGNVDEPDIVITGTGKQMFDNMQCIFDVQHTIDVHAPLEDDPDEWGGSLAARRHEVTAERKATAFSRWQSAAALGQITESFKICDLGLLARSL